MHKYTDGIRKAEGAPQAATMDDVRALMDPIPMRIVTARGTGMAKGGEDRAYAAGKAAYQNRAASPESPSTVAPRPIAGPAALAWHGSDSFN